MIDWILSGVEKFTPHDPANEYVDIEKRTFCIILKKVHALKPKHAFLVMAIRNVPGITDLVTILNGFDHTLSSSRLNFRRSKQLLSSLLDRYIGVE